MGVRETAGYRLGTINTPWKEAFVNVSSNPGWFQVRGARPQLTTGVIHAEDPAALSQWLKSISNNIVGLTNLQVGDWGTASVRVTLSICILQPFDVKVKRLFCLGYNRRL